MSLRLLLPFSSLLLWSAVSGHSQLLINAPNWVYQQNFDSLPSTNVSSNVWTNNGTLPGWYAQGHTSAKTSIYASNGVGSSIVSGGANTAATAQSFGSGADRAFGFYPTGSSGIQYLLLSLQNTSGATINEFAISYEGVKFDSAAASQPLQLFYRTSASALNVNTVIANDAGWTALPTLAYQPGDGANSQTLSATLTSLGLDNGEYLMFRFKIVNSSAPVGVDDFSLAAIPEPHTAALAFAGLGAWVLRRRMRKGKAAAAPQREYL